MNDHIDPGLIAKVKEWAKVRGQGQGTPPHLGDAVAEFITAMPDQMIDAGKVRELANLHRKWGEEGSWAPKTINIHTQIAEVLESLLPPSLPTLTDLIERGPDTARYQWMQAEHRDERCIIIRINSHAYLPTVSLLTATGATIWASTDEVIPLPDLPRLVWPDEFSPEQGKEAPTNAGMSEDTRMATVELPNVGDGGYRCRADHLDPFRLKRGTHKILTEIEGVLVKAGSDVDFHIADNEIEEFALALLALHHQRTETQ